MNKAELIKAVAGRTGESVEIDGGLGSGGHCAGMICGWLAHAASVKAMHGSNAVLSGIVGFLGDGGLRLDNGDDAGGLFCGGCGDGGALGVPFGLYGGGALMVAGGVGGAKDGNNGGG